MLGALGLLFECGLRGTAAGAERFGGITTAPDYLAVPSHEGQS